MKKISIIALLVLGMSALVGCKKNENASIVGTWKVENVKIYDKGGKELGEMEPEKPQYYIFESNGSYSAKVESVTFDSGTYTLEGTTLKVKGSSGDEKKVEVTELTNNTLKLKSEVEDHPAVASPVASVSNDVKAADNAESGSSNENIPAYVISSLTRQ